MLSSNNIKILLSTGPVKNLAIKHFLPTSDAYREFCHHLRELRHKYSFSDCRYLACREWKTECMDNSACECAFFRVTFALYRSCVGFLFLFCVSNSRHLGRGIDTWLGSFRTRRSDRMLLLKPVSQHNGLNALAWQRGIEHMYKYRIFN